MASKLACKDWKVGRLSGSSSHACSIRALYSALHEEGIVGLWAS